MDAAQWPQGIIGGEISKNSEKKKPRPEKEQAALNCPRCKSTNTKFCYYNNYSLTQPRYFCKNCRRYWTHGGTLRNVPVGGSSRKNKRPSSSSSSSSSSINPRNPSFNGVPFMQNDQNLSPQNPNSGGLSSLASPPVPDPGSAFMSSGFPMHVENRFVPVQDGSTAFEEARGAVDGFWSGMLFSSGGSW